MKRTTYLVIGLIVLGGLAGVAWWSGQKESGTSTLGKDRLFRIEDTDQIHKIFLAHRDGETVTLERKGRDWVYNDTWTARENAMENLLHAIRTIQMKYKPAEAAVPNMVKDLATYGIKVELYNHSGQLLKAYYVGGGTADERGTHVIMEGAEQPYVAHLPGWQGNLRFRYNLRGDEWRDKSVFAERPDDIARVTIDYPRQKSKAFQLERTGSSFSVQPLHPTTTTIAGRPAPGAAERFVYGFESLVAEAFENQNPRRDSILQTLPFSVIQVARKNGTTKEVRLYPVRPLTTIWDAGQDVPNRPIERYFAATNDGDFFLVQHRVFRRILWPYQAFFAQTDTSG